MSKLSIDDKVKIYNEKKQGKSVTYLAKKYSVNQSVIKYIVRLIDRHGIDVLKEKKYRKFTHERIQHDQEITKDYIFIYIMDRSYISIGLMLYCLKNNIKL